MKNQIADKMNYNMVLCNHLMKITNSIERIFDSQVNAAGIPMLASPNSRMQSLWAQVRALEALLYPNLSTTYFNETKTAKGFLKEWPYEPEELFESIQTVLQKLMMEANNKGLLFPEKDSSTDFEEEIE